VYFQLHLNATRGGVKSIPNVQFQRSEARKHLKLMMAPRDSGEIITDSMIPDFLVTSSMIDRWLAIDPPVFRVRSDFDPILEEIERAYVFGFFFSALAAAVVTVERMLNSTRIDLHPYVSPKIKQLWDKGPTNDWQPNIDALVTWGYLSEKLAGELQQLYELRCKYLHTGSLADLEKDSFQAINVAYSVLKEIVGFPPRLFGMTNGALKILNAADPLFQVFYKPHIIATPEVEGTPPQPAGLTTRTS